jgi:hypothetical protein
MLVTAQTLAEALCFLKSSKTGKHNRTDECRGVVDESSMFDSFVCAKLFKAAMQSAQLRTLCRWNPYSGAHPALPASEGKY